MSISLDMSKSPNDTDFIVLLILQGLWNQETLSSLKITSLVGAIYLGIIFLSKINKNLPHQVIDWLLITTRLRFN